MKLKMLFPTSQVSLASNYSDPSLTKKILHSPPPTTTTTPPQHPYNVKKNVSDTGNRTRALPALFEANYSDESGKS
jgi:hypothetical protein